ncbi:MAG: rhomboid family intramembrane serine protease [Chlamydiales bacterium]
MRLICTITSDENPNAFSTYLAQQGIDNECEAISSEGEGPRIFRIWVYEEDLVEKAQALYQNYRVNPQNPIYRVQHEPQVSVQEERPPQKRSRRFFSPAPYGPVSIAVLITVFALFIWAQFQRGVVIPPAIVGIVPAPILAPVERSLIYDYPEYFKIRDHLFTIYTPEDIKEKKPPPPEARRIIQELRATPTWTGLYDRFVAHFRDPQIPLSYDGPMFEKIRQGEIWRVFTPALLHFDLLHIFFNVLWFILLGNQIEYRIGWPRYLAFIVFTGIVSNTAQYLMSGPFFLGLSGIVCAMAGFIWARQQVAPWEGYLLHRFTLIFLASFVIGMFILQVVFFFMQIYGKTVTIGIANTAHLTGAFTGYILGRMRFFAIKSQKRKLTLGHSEKK